MAAPAFKHVYSLGSLTKMKTNIKQLSYACYKNSNRRKKKKKKKKMKKIKIDNNNNNNNNN